jgi:MerR family copper efflux transcriptional regulator
LTLERFRARYYVRKVKSNPQSTTLLKTLRAGELARACGISTDTLRHYERVGVLPKPQRTSAGYRQYPAEAVARVRTVRRALDIGFSLAELARFMRARERGGTPCREVRALAVRKLADLERRLEELTILRDQMRQLVVDWEQKLEATPEGMQAHLLDALENIR